jgi:hypothetical protein
LRYVPSSHESTLFDGSTTPFTIDTIPGAIAPTGIFDPLSFAAKADENTLKRYREAELTHGRVGKSLVMAVTQSTSTSRDDETHVALS